MAGGGLDENILGAVANARDVSALDDDDRKPYSAAARS